MPRTARAPRSAWNLFPWIVVGVMGFVVLVNGGMVWQALSTFPGVAATDVFDHSNQYDEVLAMAEREAALGWTLQAQAESGAVILTLADRTGAPLAGARVAGTALRPLGPDHAAMLVFNEVAPGQYQSDAMLDEGQWSLRLAVTKGADTLHATRRLIAK
jgi:nitrogen fixation protein FixH